MIFSILFITFSFRKGILGVFPSSCFKLKDVETTESPDRHEVNLSKDMNVK